MGSLLKKSDVDRLLTQPSPHVRAIVAGKLAREIESSSLSEHELQLALETLRKIATDTEIVVRVAVAQSLRLSKHLPHDVALRLATDIEAVALPVLKDSTVLTDDDLIEILENGGAVKQKAIATRAVVSEKLSDAVITKSSEMAVAALMSNKGAQITDDSFGKAIDRFFASDLVKESMVKRDALPAVVSMRLVDIVSEKLQEYLVAHHNLPETIAADVMTRSREMAIIQLNRNASLDETARLVHRIYTNGRLTPSLVLRALCVGNLAFFEFALAQMAGISLVNTRILIHDQGEDSLKSLCEKAHLPLDYLPIIRLALGVIESTKLGDNDEDIQRFRAHVIELILTKAENISDKDAEYFIDLIRQD